MKNATAVSVGGGITVPRSTLAAAIKMERAKNPANLGFTPYRKLALQQRNARIRTTAAGLLRADAKFVN